MVVRNGVVQIAGSREQERDFAAAGVGQEPLPFRSDRYETKDDVDDIEALSKKLSSDLRRHIRRMGSYPVLSVS